MPNHLCYKAKRNVARKYRNAILKAKKNHLANFLEEAIDHDLWTSNRYLKDPIGNGRKAKISMLEVKEDDGSTKEIASNAEKAKIFSPPMPEALLVPSNYPYLAPLPTLPVITKDQICRHVNSLSAYKASRPDGISNVVLQKL